MVRIRVQVHKVLVPGLGSNIRVSVKVRVRTRVRVMGMVIARVQG